MFNLVKITANVPAVNLQNMKFVLTVPSDPHGLQCISQAQSISSKIFSQSVQLDLKSSFADVSVAKLSF